MKNIFYLLIFLTLVSCGGNNVIVWNVTDIIGFSLIVFILLLYVGFALLIYFRNIWSNFKKRWNKK